MNESESLVSIIVPVYNAERFLEDSITTILNQTYKNIEIIMIDDGSNDSSFKIMNKLASKDARFSVYSQENKGVSYTRNRGLQLSNGDYILFFDSDDVLESDFVEKMLFAIQEKKADLVCCRYRTSSKKNVSSQNIYELSEKEYFRELFLPTKSIDAFVWNRLYKKHILNKKEITFDENVKACEDTLFNYEYMLNCEKIAYIDEELYLYNINNGSAMFSKDFNKNKLTAISAFEKILDECNKDQISLVEVSAMLYFCIVAKQIISSGFHISEVQRKTIIKILKSNPMAFFRERINWKYKLSYPFVLFLISHYRKDK